MYTFNAKKVKDELVEWIRSWFDINGKDCNCIIGISGGKDSSIVASLCVEALGKDRVIGVKMPCGIQEDENMSDLLILYLGIKSFRMDVYDSIDSILYEMNENGCDISQQTKQNLPARIRMACLYAISQSYNGRVANTCNLSEDWVGYATRYGDGAGDFSPLSKLTVQEVKAIGRELKLPEELIEKPPIDGLCGKTDEDNLGFTYEVLDKYIRTGEIDDISVKNKIDKMRKNNMFKLELMKSFDPKFDTKETI